MAKPPTRFGQSAQRRRVLAARPSDDTGDRVGVEQVALDELEPVTRGQPLELSLDDPRDHDSPAVREQPFDNGGAEPAGPSGDDCGAVHRPTRTLLAVRAPLSSAFEAR